MTTPVKYFNKVAHNAHHLLLASLIGIGLVAPDSDVETPRDITAPAPSSTLISPDEFTTVVCQAGKKSEGCDPAILPDGPSIQP